ncbi:thioesterase family protein [soil metagenome]
MRFAETDQMGIAHHSAYVIWIEAARVEWLRERGQRYRDLEDAGVSLAVSGLELRYRASARFDDELDIHTRLTEARSRRLRFAYRIVRLEDGALLALAATEHVPSGGARAMRLPEPWLAVMKASLEAG